MDMDKIFPIGDYQLKALEKYDNSELYMLEMKSTRRKEENDIVGIFRSYECAVMIGKILLATDSDGSYYDYSITINS